MNTLRENRTACALGLFIGIAAAVVIAGVCVLHTPIVALCVLVIVETALAVAMHHAQLWLHALLVLVQLCAGIAAGRTVLILLCLAVYIAATATLQASDKGETENGQ